MDDNRFLVEQPVGRLMRGYALPCIISLLVGALYNIVDQIFIANADYLGSNGNAANTVVFPLTVVMLAVAVMIGDGCCTFVSLQLGSGNKEEAHAGVGNAIVLVVAASLVMTILFALFRDQLITAFGGRVNAELFHFAQEYFAWIIVGIPLYMFGQAMNAIIRGDGSPKFAMACTVAGAVFNIIFDPIFIFGFRMGMAGAAIATVLGQLLTAVLSTWYLCHLKAIRLERRSFRLRPALDRRMLTMGITSFLSQISLVAAMAAINNMIRITTVRDPFFVQPEFSQIPMAVVGIVMKVFQIVISIVVGMAAGCIPVVGYNMGAGRYDRTKGLLDKLLFWEVVVGVVALVVVEVFPRALIGIFGASHESEVYTQFAIKAFRIYLCLLPLATLNKAAFIFLQAMGKPMASSLLSLFREVVLGVGFAIMLPMLFGLDGVLYAMPAADLLTAVASIAVIILTYRELGVRSQAVHQDGRVSSVSKD